MSMEAEVPVALAGLALPLDSGNANDQRQRIPLREDALHWREKTQECELHKWENPLNGEKSALTGPQ